MMKSGRWLQQHQREPLKKRIVLYTWLNLGEVCSNLHLITMRVTRTFQASKLKLKNGKLRSTSKLLH